MQNLLHGVEKSQRDRQINLQLAALGKQAFINDKHSGDAAVAEYLRESFLLQHSHKQGHCFADSRINHFLTEYFIRFGLENSPQLPVDTFILSRSGIAQELSIPHNSDTFTSEYIKSYRVTQGVLHNPVNDRRTTKGVFHVVEGGLAIPNDKKAVPVNSFYQLLKEALKPPRNLLRLPYTSEAEQPAELWVSLMLRPTVCPAIPGISEEKTMEVRFFAPGGLVANLDFVERIFGNGGNPFKVDNDAALDIKHWTGQSGCVILAPHLVNFTKKELGLPFVDKATERQKKDGMCWQDETEKYNNGQPFKITCRNEAGVIVTIIADNYFGYSKKEIKSQISYAANLYGNCEEEHSGAALAFPSYNLGDQFETDSSLKSFQFNKHDYLGLIGVNIDLRPEGYGVDKNYPDIIYVPQETRFDLYDQSVSWKYEGKSQQIKLLLGHTYILPNGFKIHMEQHPQAPTWRLIGTEAEGTLCHKPSTVSGGGKSEIAKSISDAIVYGSFYVDDIETDFDMIQSIIDKDYSQRYLITPDALDQRSLLSPNRSLGSVIRLLTPSEKVYTESYNAWLESIPQHIRALVFVIKRFYRQEWGDQWRDKFSVDMVNGYPGHELKYNGRKLVASYLRVGREDDGAWRLHKLRQDYIASEKVQMADDITASVTVPAKQLYFLNNEYHNHSVKLIENCERYLFQRPDDAIHRGQDKQAERDLATPNTFMSNFEPLALKDARELIENVISFCKYTQPMQDLIKTAATSGKTNYFVSSAHSRLVEGIPSPNMRYLQLRPDVANQRSTYLANVGTRLNRRVPMNQSINYPVNAVLQGRRNNPPHAEKKIPALAVYNPIHYQELPELFMDFISSLTGKSPSTTGAGSEGALTKGPFNSLSATIDLNNALVSFILCGFDGFSSAAGYVGPNYKVDHDISLLIPEIWSRLPIRDRDPMFLIEKGYLEKCEDFVCGGDTVYASRLGYRITQAFVHAYFGKIFDNPTDVFDEAMLKPELQDKDAFIAGINNIVDAHQRVAQNYFEDGTIEFACPPLKALLTIMAQGEYQGMDINHPEIRNMFTYEYLISSKWYRERLLLKQQKEIQLSQTNIAYIEKKLQQSNTVDENDNLTLILGEAKEHMAFVQSDAYLKSLQGTIGADPLA